MAGLRRLAKDGAVHRPKGCESIMTYSVERWWDFKPGARHHAAAQHRIDSYPLKAASSA